MSGQCRYCGYDGCVCDDDEKSMSKLLPHEKAYLKKLTTHTPDKCEGRPCCVHNPSDHSMRGWEMIFRFDKGVMERICPEHGVGHPDPDDIAFWISVDRPYMSIHGCCGCCVDDINKFHANLSDDEYYANDL